MKFINSVKNRPFEKSSSTVKAYIFDLDGVITDTAKVHRQAWKESFDLFFQSQFQGSHFANFDINIDYPNHLDGKSRLLGIRCVLESRGIHLPLGQHTDQTLKSVQGIGNYKNQIFRNLIKSKGVTCFDDAIELVEQLSNQNVLLGLASSSKNSEFILDHTTIKHCFHRILDGNDVARLGMASKPAGDIYLECFRLLNLRADECIIIEDAVAGIEAARAANPFLVVGINRLEQSNVGVLKSHGADVVLDDLCELMVESRDGAYAAG